MGRDRAERVSSAPRGLGLYRRAGRSGFFFVKNLAVQAKKYPERIKPAFIDEWIKRADGSLVTSQKEAETYCLRRNAQIQDMLLSLAGEIIHYSGSDIEGISRQLAEQWIRSKQRGVNLQQMEIERLRLIARYGCKEIANILRESNSGGLMVLQEVKNNQILRQPPIRPEELEAEARKIEQLCWNSGHRPSENQLDQITVRFSELVQEHLKEAMSERNKGSFEPPKPKLERTGASWQQLIEAKKAEGGASGTFKGLESSIKRLQNWLVKQHGVKLPSIIDAEIAQAYRGWLFGGESGLAYTTAGKEMRYLNGVFNAGLRQKMITTNPFQNLPKDRRSSMHQKLEARKTFNKNKAMSTEDANVVFTTMAKDKRGQRDPGYDIFFLQSITGARIQEIAGLRKCDFSQHSFNGANYKCIDIKPWSERGFGVMGQRGGLKTVQSERVIPLPKLAEPLWRKYHQSDSTEPAFPSEKPSGKGNWGDNLKRRMKSKIPTFKGTHAWRETLIQNLQGDNIQQRIVEMVTGKSSHSTLSDYYSDDLRLMAEALERNSSILGVPQWVECEEAM